MFFIRYIRDLHGESNLVSWGGKVTEIEANQLPIAFGLYINIPRNTSKLNFSDPGIIAFWQ